MLRCLFCFEPCSRAHVESEEEVNQRALQELQSIGNLRHPSSPTQALNGSVIQADAFSNAEGNNTNSGGTADAQQEGQQQGQHASFGRKGVKSCHDDFEVNRLVRYLKEGSWAMRAMAAEELWKEASVRPLVQVLAQHDVAPALVTLLRDGTELGKIYAAYTLLVLLQDPTSVDKVVDEGAVQALLQAVVGSHLPAARMAALRVLARLARHRRAAAVLMALEGHKVLSGLLSGQDRHSSWVKGALVTLYYLGADKNHIQDALGRLDLIPRLLELCVCDDTSVAEKAVQVVKVLCKSALCCRTLQTAGAEAVLKSILARATQVDRRAGSAGKDEHANGSSPAISGDKDNSNIRQIAPEGEHPAQIALERLELVLRTQHNIPSTRPKNHVQPYELEGPMQQQLLFGKPTPCTPAPPSPAGADGISKDTPARGNGKPDGAGAHRHIQSALVNGSSSGSGGGKVSSSAKVPPQSAHGKKQGKKRVAWVGVPDQQLQPAPNQTPLQQQPMQEEQQQQQQQQQQLLQFHAAQPTEFDFGSGGGQRAQEPATVQAFVVVPCSATVSRAFEQQHKSTGRGMSAPAPHSDHGVGGDGGAQGRPGAGEQPNGDGGGAEHGSGAGLHLDGDGVVEDQSGAGVQLNRAGGGPGSCTWNGMKRQLDNLQQKQVQGSLQQQQQQQQQQLLHNGGLPDVELTHQHEQQKAAGSAEEARVTAVGPPKTAAAAAATTGAATTGAAATGAAAAAAEVTGAVFEGATAPEAAVVPAAAPRQPHQTARLSPAQPPTESAPSPACHISLSSAQPHASPVPPAASPKVPVPLHQHTPAPAHPSPKIPVPLSQGPSAPAPAHPCTSAPLHPKTPLSARPGGYAKLLASPPTSRRSGASSELFDSMSTPILPMPPLRTSAARVSPQSQPNLRTWFFFSSADVLSAGAGVAAETEHGSASDTPDAPASATVHRRSKSGLWNGYPRQKRKGAATEGSSGPRHLAHGGEATEPSGESAFDRGDEGANGAFAGNHSSGAAAPNGKARRLLNMGAGGHGGAQTASAKRGTPERVLAWRSAAPAAGSNATPARHPASAPMPTLRVPESSSGGEEVSPHAAAQLPSLSPLRLHVPVSRSVSSRSSSSSSCSSSSSSGYVSSCCNTGEAFMRESPTALTPNIIVGSPVTTPHASFGHGPSPLGRQASMTIARGASGATIGEASGAKTGGASGAIIGGASRATTQGVSGETKSLGYGVGGKETTSRGGGEEEVAEGATGAFGGRVEEEANVGEARQVIRQASCTQPSPPTTTAAAAAINASPTSAFALPSHAPLATILPPTPPMSSPLMVAHLTPFTSDPNYSPPTPTATTATKPSYKTSSSSLQSTSSNAPQPSLSQDPTGPATYSNPPHQPTSCCQPHTPQPQPQSQPQERASQRRPIRPPAAFLSASAPASRVSVREAVAAIQRLPSPSQQHHRLHAGGAPPPPLPPGQDTQRNVHRHPRSPVRRASGGSFKAVDSRRMSERCADHRMSQDSGWRSSKTDAYLSHHPFRQPLQGPRESHTAARPLSSSLCRVVPRQDSDPFRVRRASGSPMSEGSASAQGPTSRAELRDSCP